MIDQNTIKDVKNKKIENPNDIPAENSWDDFENDAEESDSTMMYMLIIGLFIFAILFAAIGFMSYQNKGKDDKFVKEKYGEETLLSKEESKIEPFSTNGIPPPTYDDLINCGQYGIGIMVVEGDVEKTNLEKTFPKLEEQQKITQEHVDFVNDPKQHSYCFFVVHKRDAEKTINYIIDLFSSKGKISNTYLNCLSHDVYGDYNHLVKPKYINAKKYLINPQFVWMDIHFEELEWMYTYQENPPDCHCFEALHATLTKTRDKEIKGTRIIECLY